MPNSSLHISFARDAAEILGNPLVDDYMGSYMLGSTAPDIRNLAGWDRYTTHFFRLNTDQPGKGIEGLFKHHPELAEAGKLRGETRAFVAGYISHLIADEIWIAGVYRPFFGTASPMAEDPLRNVIDRVFQFELDRIERNGLGDLEGVLSLLKDSDTGVEVGFIDSELLREWRQIIYDRTARDLPWEHIKRFARRGLPEELKDDEQALDLIAKQAPQLLEKAQVAVPAQAISEYRAKAIQETATALGEYLD